MSEKGIAVRSLDDVERLARIAVGSGYTSCRKAEEAAMLIITGHELGLSPAQSLRGIYVVSGKPVLSADLMVAVVRRSGQCESWRVVESTAERCTIVTRRRGESHDATRTWTMADAKRAGVTGKSVWSAFPAAMLRHRCAADLARQEYPDVLMGLYDPEELGGEPEVEEVRPIEAAQPAVVTREALDAMDASTQAVQAAEVRALAPPAAEPADVVADIEVQAERCGSVGQLADLWIAARADVARLPKAAQTRAWKLVGQRAEVIGSTAGHVRAEVTRRDTPPRDDGPGGGQRPETAQRADARGSANDTAPAQGALAMVPPWCTDFAAMEAHVAAYSCTRHLENACRRYRQGLPPAARELMALRYQRLSWDPHDGEVTIESARRLVAAWIAQGPIERVRPAARAKIAAGGAR